MRAAPAVLCAALLALGTLRPALRAGEPAAAIVFFESAAPAGGDGDVDLMAQKVGVDGALLWNGGQPLMVGASTHHDIAPVACADGQGGAILAYVVEFTGGEYAGDSDVEAQRVGPDGRLLWNADNAPVTVGSLKLRESAPAIVSDGQGGAIVVYVAHIEDAGTDLLAKRLSPEGKPVWNEGKPVVLAASKGNERSPVLVPDGLGGALVFYEWENAGDVDVMAQRLTADGRLAWNEGRRSLDVASTKHAERHPVAVPDGEGGAILAFEIEFTEGDALGDHDVVARRVAGDGRFVWGDSFAVLGGSAQLEREPAIAALIGGGAVVAYEVEFRSGESAGDIDVFAQRIDGRGVPLWNDGKAGKPVGTSRQQDRHPAVLSFGLEDVVVAMGLEFVTGESAGDRDVMAQALSGAGGMLWNEGKLSAVVGGSPWLESSPILLPDGAGGLLCVYSATGVGEQHAGDMDVQIQRLDRQGRPVWNDGKRSVDVVSTARIERHPCAVFVPSR